MSIEELSTRFVALASKPSLSKVEHNEAVTLMRRLKEAGMSNDEIFKLSRGRWTPSTIKGYAKGIKTVSPSPWDDAITLLNDLISIGLTLDDVEAAVTIHRDLREQGLVLDQIAELLLATDSASVDLSTVVSIHEGLNQFGLSYKNMAEALSLKKELEEKGLILDSLVPLVELAKKHGEPQQIIQALSQYASLVELKKQTTATNDELETVKQELAHGRQQLEEIEAKFSQMKEPLEVLHATADLGFTVTELRKLSSLASKYGGVKAVLDAANGYANYTDILTKIQTARATLEKKEAEIGKVEAEYGHLKTVMTMCDTLIHQYKFGLDAISTIFSVAKKYGEPIEVLKTIESYGKLQVLQEGLNKLEGEISKLTQLLAQLQGEYQETLDKLESLNTTALKIGAEVGKVEGELAASRQWRALMNLIKDPAVADYATYGPTALVFTVALLKWVSSNEGNFKSSYDIKSGLQSLIKQLGGVW